MFEIFGKFCGLLYVVDSEKRVCHSLTVFFVCFFFLSNFSMYLKRNVFFIKIFVKIDHEIFVKLADADISYQYKGQSKDG